MFILIMQTLSKPKLVFFRFTGKNLPAYILIHLQEQVKCLSEFFDVVVINGNCDYKLICDKYQPDMALFESGVYAGPREIKNTSAYPEIPKAGFCNADAYCMTRSVFLSDMERWNINTYFSLSVSMPDYTPAISDNLFVWPNFIDAKTYRDYGESKVIPILLSGSQAAHYPWRKRIRKILAQNYPVLTCPHFGWFDDQLTSRMVHGESYARMINASLMAPTCGTIANELVRKHLEIPACKTCLVTEKTPVVEVAGFVDMENCVFVDSNNVLDKIEYLFKNPDELERITQAGFDLVHSRHTSIHRNQLYQWFQLYKGLKPNERIVQTNPFEPLIVVDSNSPQQNSRISTNGLDRQLLCEGDRKLWNGNYKEAERHYIRCLNYHFMSEAILRLALCHLYQGNPSQAATLLADLIERSIKRHGAVDPDPVEWAYFIISLICQDKLEEAIKRINQFPSLRHNELDRVSALIKGLCESPVKFRTLSKESIKYRKSIHQLPEFSEREWLNNIIVMLKACGQNNYFNKLEDNGSILCYEPAANNLLNRQVFRAEVAAHQKIFPLISIPFPLRVYRVLVRKINSAIDRIRRYIKNTRFFSHVYAKNRIMDELVFELEALTREEDIETVVVIGASGTVQYTQAVLDGASKNPNDPDLFFINESSRSFSKTHKNNNNCRNLKYKKYLIKNIKERNNIRCFGLVVYDLENFQDTIEFEDIVGADFIAVNGVKKYEQFLFLERLRKEKDYSLLSQEMEQGYGYAIFIKTSIQSAPDSVHQNAFLFH